MAAVHPDEKFSQSQIRVQVLLRAAAPVIEVTGDDHGFIPGYVTVYSVGEDLQLFAALLFQQSEVDTQCMQSDIFMW